MQDVWYDAADHVSDEEIWHDSLSYLVDVDSPTHKAGSYKNSKSVSGSYHMLDDLTSARYANLHDVTRGKLLNMSVKNLSHITKNMFYKGPHFALSRTINRHVIREAEIGVERSAFALRWREHIEEQHNTREQHIPHTPQQHV